MVYDELNYLNMSTLRQLSCRHEICHHFVQGLVAGFAQVSVLCNLKMKEKLRNQNFEFFFILMDYLFYLVQKGSLGGLDVFHELLFEIGDLAGVNFVQKSTYTAVDDCDLFLNSHGYVLALLQKLSQPDTTVQQLLGGSVQIGTELGESGDLTILGQLQLHGTSDLNQTNISISNRIKIRVLHSIPLVSLWIEK